MRWIFCNSGRRLHFASVGSRSFEGGRGRRTRAGPIDRLLLVPGMGVNSLPHQPTIFSLTEGSPVVEGKYFVTVIAPDRAALLRLASYELDLLHQTAAVTERRTVRLAAARDKPNEYVEA